MQPYNSDIEQQMQRYYQSLSEKDRRRYAAIEALKLGYGGISYMVALLGCHAHTVRRGMEELKDERAMSDKRTRQPGGGRKRVREQIKGLDEAFLRVIEDHTAGSPMDESIKWTHLTRQEIADLLCQESEISVSVTVVDQLLKQLEEGRRQEAEGRREQLVGDSNPPLITTPLNAKHFNGGLEPKCSEGNRAAQPIT